MIKKKCDSHLLHKNIDACPDDPKDRLMSAFGCICDEALTEIYALNQIMECLDDFQIGPFEVN